MDKTLTISSCLKKIVYTLQTLVSFENNTYSSIFPFEIIIIIFRYINIKSIFFTLSKLNQATCLTYWVALGGGLSPPPKPVCFLVFLVSHNRLGGSASV
jgi:hypothetical protein